MAHLQMIYPLKIVIFHSYVSLLEGIHNIIDYSLPRMQSPWPSKTMCLIMFNHFSTSLPPWLKKPSPGCESASLPYMNSKVFLPESGLIADIWLSGWYPKWWGKEPSFHENIIVKINIWVNRLVRYELVLSSLSMDINGKKKDLTS